MGPVHRIAAHVHRACDGAPIAVGQATTWLTAATATDRRRTLAQRGAIAVVGGWAAMHAGPGALAVAVPAAIAWAHRLGPKSADKQAAPAAPLDPAAARLRDLTAIRGAIGDRRGIHLAEITDRVQAAGIDWDMADVRAWITGHGVTIRPKVRVGGKAGRVSVGVHVDDLDAALDPAPRSDPDPSPAGVAAGHEPLHPPLQVELEPAGERCYTLDDEPVWPGTTTA